ncbi:hypothetical protein G7Y89_g15543 [Cudoniella acicularis]|uniref:PNPLA domain-containing protein n=1 Tax=Cudoniella acicularis TaxID=354080 RepID=A0A8H4QKK6_9HELO|nr:hypothetical protein G7Y89_g15543 [Cudoniella acicularis]
MQGVLVLIDEYYDMSSSSRIPSSTGRVHVLAEPSSTSDTSFDIIAIHGLMGHWDKSWRDGTTNFFWLKEVLPETLPSCRIISYECVDLSRDLADRDVDSIWQDLMNNRRNNDRSHIPIIFLCAQFGGSAIKELFVSTSPQRTQRAEVREFHSCIRGLALFSTAQGDQVIPDSIKSLPFILKVYTLGLSSRVKSLEKILKQVLSINYDFRSLWGEQVQSVYFHDTAKPKGFKTPIAGLPIATMSSSSSKKVPLHLEMSRMTKFESRDDSNLLTVLNYLQILLQRAQQPTTLPSQLIEAERTQSHSGLRILSLDGGGVRGLFSIMVLEKVLEEVHQLEGGIGSTPKPCEVFNLIGGTSTGGLLAIMLGRLQMDLVSCKKAYREMSQDIFRRGGLRFPGKQWIDALRGVPWFSGDALEAAIRGVVRERISSAERTHLRETGREPTEAPLLSQDESAPKCFVCAIVNATHECVRLRTYNSTSGAEELLYTIWEAGRATSAAPLYFPPTEIQGHRYYDGGMQSNNPVLETIEEAYLLYGVDASVHVIVSIGTGKSESHEPTGNLISVLKSLSARATNTEAKHDEFRRRYENLDDSYF